MIIYQKALTTSNNSITFLIMSETRQRIKNWLKSIHKNYAWLAQQCMVGEGAVKNWMSTKNIPKAKLLLIEKLIQETEKESLSNDAEPAFYLREGKVPVLALIDPEIYKLGVTAAKKMGISVEEFTAMAFHEDAIRHAQLITTAESGNNLSLVRKQDIGTSSSPPLSEEFHEIPLLHAAAGSPIDAHSDSFTLSRRLGPDRFGVQVHGDSMSPLIPDGKVVILREKSSLKKPLLKKGEIYLFVIKGERTLKRYNTRPATTQEIADEISYTSPNRTQKVRILESVNPAYPEIVISHEHIEWLGWLDKDDN